MRDLVHEISDILTKDGKTLATAESCTGGLLANLITNMPGSSEFFKLGVVTYSNESKIDLLKVPEEIIAKTGAVSKETAYAMAKGVRQLADTDLGIGITGIAGPSGGTPEKPVGLVYVALASDSNVLVHKFQFDGSRLEIKQLTAEAALKIVFEVLEK
jgi:PncC family amidohydrolase